MLPSGWGLRTHVIWNSDQTDHYQTIDFAAIVLKIEKKSNGSLKDLSWKKILQPQNLK